MLVVCLPGESMFMATYTATKAGAEIAFASTVAGEVLPINIGETGGFILPERGISLC